MHSLLLYILAVLTIALIPGPDVLFIMTQSINHGRAAGIAAVLGISFGILFHITAASLGLSVILLHSPMIFTIIKYLGAAYLFYLGMKAFLEKTHRLNIPHNHRNISLTQCFMRGWITNILNPKVILFFLAFLPQFVMVEKGHVTLQIFLLGLIFISIGTLTNGLFAIFFSFVKQWLLKSPHVLHWQSRITGTILISLGLKLALTARQI